MSTFRQHHINLILKCFPVPIDYKGISDISFRHSSLYFRLCIGQINPVKNVHFPPTGSVERSQYRWKKGKKTLAENGAHASYLPFCALPAGGNCVQSIFTHLRVSVLTPPKTSTNIRATWFQCSESHRQNSLKLCPFWLMSNEFSMCFV